MTAISLNLGDRHCTVELKDNAPVRALLPLLPLATKMGRSGGHTHYGPAPVRLPVGGAPVTSTSGGRPVLLRVPDLVDQAANGGAVAEAGM
jgi:hypothetical protein